MMEPAEMSPTPTWEEAPRLLAPIVATAIASLTYILFWTVTTQVPEVRAVVPFGEDPYDLVASVAILLLPLVGGLTAIRVLRYGPTRIPAGAVAVRIELGMAICLGLVSAALAAAIVALWRTPMDGRGVPVAAGFAAATALAGWVSLARAVAASNSARIDRPEPLPADPEPDTFDDLVAVLPLTGTLRARLAAAAGPIRRHRIATGLWGSLGAALVAVIWHAIREGAWATPGAALLYGGVLVAILFVAYALLVGPLRVLRRT